MIQKFAKQSLKVGGLSLIFLLLIIGKTLGQEPTVSPTPDDPIKISVEEVHLNVIAQNSNGSFTQNLTPDNLLVVEEGDPQVITNIKKVPANVLLLLDSGGNLNFIKRVLTTRLIAKTFLYSLSDKNKIAVMQYNDKVELLSDWTDDFKQVDSTLDTKLLSGKRSRFSDALNSAIETFKSRPVENRHIVLITDGLESVADKESRQKAIEKLIAANITVHVLSYTQLEGKVAKKASARFKLGDGKTKPRVDPLIWEDIIKSIPNWASPLDVEKFREHLRMMNTSQAIVKFDLDRERRKKILEKYEEWEASEKDLGVIAADTGGVFQAPEEIDTLFKLSVETAKAIDSSYVITYIPRISVAEFGNNKPRKVRVSTSLSGVQIHSREKVIWNPAESK